MKFELYIYGKNDEVVKKYGTDHIRYGILEDALELQESTKGQLKLESVNALVMRVFKGLTTEELKDADIEEVINLFKQIISLSNGLKVKNSSGKN